MTTPVNHDTQHQRDLLFLTDPRPTALESTINATLRHLEEGYIQHRATGIVAEATKMEFDSGSQFDNIGSDEAMALSFDDNFDNVLFPPSQYLQSVLDERRGVLEKHPLEDTRQDENGDDNRRIDNATESVTNSNVTTHVSGTPNGGGTDIGQGSDSANEGTKVTDEECHAEFDISTPILTQTHPVENEVRRYENPSRLVK